MKFALWNSLSITKAYIGWTIIIGVTHERTTPILCAFVSDDLLLVNVLSGWMHRVYWSSCHTIIVQYCPCDLSLVSPEQVTYDFNKATALAWLRRLCSSCEDRVPIMSFFPGFLSRVGLPITILKETIRLWIKRPKEFYPCSWRNNYWWFSKKWFLRHFEKRSFFSI